MFKFSRAGWRAGRRSLLFIANNDITIKFNRTGKEIQKNKIEVKLHDMFIKPQILGNWTAIIM